MNTEEVRSQESEGQRMTPSQAIEKLHEMDRMMICGQIRIFRQIAEVIAELMASLQTAITRTESGFEMHCEDCSRLFVFSKMQDGEWLFEIFDTTKKLGKSRILMSPSSTLEAAIHAAYEHAKAVREMIKRQSPRTATPAS